MCAISMRKRQRGERCSKRCVVTPHCAGSKNCLWVLARHRLAEHLQEEGSCKLANLVAERRALLCMQMNLVDDHKSKNTSSCLPAENHGKVGMFCKKLGRGEKEHGRYCVWSEVCRGSQDGAVEHL